MITLKVRKPKNDLERNLKISIIFPVSFCLVLLVVMMVIWVQKVSEMGVMDSRWPFGCVMLRGRPPHPHILLKEGLGLHTFEMDFI